MRMIISAAKAEIVPSEQIPARRGYSTGGIVVKTVSKMDRSETKLPLVQIHLYHSLIVRSWEIIYISMDNII